MWILIWFMVSIEDIGFAQITVNEHFRKIVSSGSPSKFSQQSFPLGTVEVAQLEATHVQSIRKLAAPMYVHIYKLYTETMFSRTLRPHAHRR